MTAFQAGNPRHGANEASDRSRSHTVPPADTRSQAQSAIPQRSRALGDTLVRMGCLKPEDIPKVLEHSARTGKKFGMSALALGLISKKDLTAALSIQQGLFHADGDRVRVPPALVTLHSPHTEEAEQFRGLRTRLLTRSDGAALRLLSVSGTGAETTSSFVALNLAVSVAQLGRKVLLIDANLRLSHLNQLLGLRHGVGLTDIINGDREFAECLAPPIVRNFTYLPAGQPAFNPQEVLCSEQFAKLVMSQIDKYDSVIVNTGDGLDTADAQLVWALTKSVLLVARRDKSRMPDIREATKLISESRANLVGTVMTR
ncbi:MAG: hypothetical protein MRY59_07575 [Aquisalinus sp.]|nr:hypothetical protein [Aquisalinus sp.]